MSQSYRELLALRHQLKKIIEEFIREMQRVDLTPGAYIPPADIFTTDESLVVCLDAPGVSAQDISVSFAAGFLTIRGEKPWNRKRRQSHNLLERTYGVFLRVIPIRDSVNVREAKAKLRDGVLRVEFPKVQNRRRQTYQIDVEEE